LSFTSRGEIAVVLLADRHADHDDASGALSHSNCRPSGFDRGFLFKMALLDMQRGVVLEHLAEVA
jgi:hypothetical protein